MDLEKLRQELLQQHEQLKRLIRTAKLLSLRIARGGAVQGPAAKLSEVLRVLDRTLRAHWEYEEVVLPPILMTIDAWGPERVERMQLDHLAEHRALAGAIASASSAERPKTLAAATRAMADQLLAHIDDEEKYLLSRRVLTYDVVRVDQRTD